MTLAPPLALALPLAITLTLGACAEASDPTSVIADCVGVDDGDPCTQDLCDEATMTPVHRPFSSWNPCAVDADCADADPCTIDTCAFDLPCDVSRCRYALVSGCRDCSQGCDDDDRCTRDACDDDDRCRFEVEPLCETRCTIPSRDPAPVRGAVRLAGTIAVDNGLGCASGACACATPVVMHTGSIPERVSLTGQGDWSCTIEGLCGALVTTACRPLEVGRHYVVWGTGLAAEGGGDRVQVDGWCLAPSELGVVGSYAATLELAGLPARTFEIALDPEGFATLPAGGEIPAQSGRWATQGETVQLELTVDGEPLRADLFPGPDRLAGPLVRSDGVLDLEPPEGPRLGTLTLVLR